MENKKECVRVNIVWEMALFKPNLLANSVTIVVQFMSVPGAQPRSAGGWRLAVIPGGWRLPARRRGATFSSGCFLSFGVGLGLSNATERTV